jgi:methyltransferase (TIGR00027 family)
MRRAFGLIAFTLVMIALSPVWLTGVAAYLVRLKLYNQPRGISGTAYEPFLSRVLAHGMGARPDEAAHRLAPALPALTPLICRLIFSPFAIASRIARYQPVMLCGPVTRPATVVMMMALRNEFFDRAFVEAFGNFDQIVILGAGWDTRAYAPLPSGDTRIYEVDTRPTQQAKIAALRDAGMERDHVTFVETDFNQVSWVDALKKSGFDPSLRTLVLWEGVTMYLPEEAVNETLAAVAVFSPGSRIVFDYFAREFIDNEGGFRVIGPYLKWSIRATYGEHFVFGIPLRYAGEDGARAFLESRGLELEEFAMAGTAGRLSAFYGFVVAEAGP